MNSNESTSALLVMDMQTMILGNLPGYAEVLQNVKSCIKKARENPIPSLYVVLGFRKGLPKISKHNISFSSYKEQLIGMNIDEMSKIAPLPEEIIVTKRRVSVFTGSYFKGYEY